MATVFNSKTSSPTNKIGTFESVISGIGSGFIQIPKGLFSLGATLLDLGVDSGKAAAVEQWFDDLTELDEKAEATAAGKITELLVNIGIPGGVGFKVAGGMAKKAMLAKKSGKYLEPANKSLQKGIQQAQALNARGRTNQFIVGALGGGVAEGVFVANTEDFGTLGDLLGGPTALNDLSLAEGKDRAVRSIVNRVKFGTEGALLTGVIGGVGATIQKVAKRGKHLKYSQSWGDRILNTIVSGFRPRGDLPEQFFLTKGEQLGKKSADLNRAVELSRNVDRDIDRMFPFLKRKTFYLFSI